ncbi:glutamate--tRNA ligase [Candidatus Parcubacteria bacterium]|nr:MAG: glutamate--tRNA ligase [Candidatus Parcubacteria bacterium]
MKKVRTRFAPSPTGYLHIGSLRTILFAYLISKSQDGDFLLRIEDTDQKRYVKGSVEKLIEILNWLGIKYDEGPEIGGDYGPYIQSERQDIYDKYIKKLLEKGEAYHCFCSAERLTELREAQQKDKLPPRYDRACRGLSREKVEKRIQAGEKYTIRQKMPLEGEIKVHDELRGDIIFKAAELEDHVLIKSNGIPTYQFASVVDDHLMEISHVTRAEEWIPSFPKNVLLYKAFNWEIPKFIHLPVVLNKGGGKLSKRQGDVTVEDFKNKGYLRQALINFNVLLGWSPYDKDKKNDKNVEILSLDEVTQIFDYKKINTSPAVFDQDKLDFFNAHYIKALNDDDLLKNCLPYLKTYLEEKNINIKNFDKNFLLKVVRVEKERMKKLSEIGEMTEFFFLDKLELDKEMLAWKKITKDDAQVNLKKLIVVLEKISENDWNKEHLETTIIEYLKTNEYKIGEYLWPMRVSLCARKNSPGPFEIAEILGKNKSINRIKEASK